MQRLDGRTIQIAVPAIHDLEFLVDADADEAFAGSTGEVGGHGDTFVGRQAF
jgi:hypothetical protein